MNNDEEKRLVSKYLSGKLSEGRLAKLLNLDRIDARLVAEKHTDEAYATGGIATPPEGGYPKLLHTGMLRLSTACRMTGADAARSLIEMAMMPKPKGWNDGKG